MPARRPPWSCIAIAGSSGRGGGRNRTLRPSRGGRHGQLADHAWADTSAPDKNGPCGVNSACTGLDTLTSDKGVGVTVLHKSAVSLAAAIRRRESPRKSSSSRRSTGATDSTRCSTRSSGATMNRRWQPRAPRTQHSPQDPTCRRSMAFRSRSRNSPGWRGNPRPSDPSVCQTSHESGCHGGGVHRRRLVPVG